MKATVAVNGYTYEGRWLSDGTGCLHVLGPLEFKRPTRGCYSPTFGWTEDSGPQGRPTDRHRRWWSAARLLLDSYGEAMDALADAGLAPRALGAGQ